MFEVRPVSDLQENLGEIHKIVCDQKKPVCLTSDGQSDMVLISMDRFSDWGYHQEVKRNLLLAEEEAGATNLRYSLDDLRSTVKQVIRGTK